MRTAKVKARCGWLAAALLSGGGLTACGSGAEGDRNGGSDLGLGAGGSALTAAQSRPAACNNMSSESHVVRNALAPGNPPESRSLLLRFVQLTDDHIIDDDGQAAIGASVLDPLIPTFDSAMRLQEEFSDEVLNNFITGLNDCNAQFPSAFAIVTGDSADLTTIAEARRFIDNLDGTFDRMSAFEQVCRQTLPAGSSEAAAQLLCTRFTGHGVADTQTSDQDINSLLAQIPLTRTLTQTLATEAAALTGRAANGSVDLSRETITRSPGMPQLLRCESGTQGCNNVALSMPYVVAFGNHDGYARGTLALGVEINVAASVFGRRLMLDQSDFINEFFFTQPDPGPVGHGFQFADAERRNDNDTENDGYYAFDAAGGQMRMIVLNTIITGRIDEVPGDLLRNPFALEAGGLDFAQFRWLKEELANAYANGQMVMTFSHHPDVSFAEFGPAAALAPVQVRAAQLDAELASWPNMIAWVSGHTHRHRVRAFIVEDGVGSNGTIARQIECKVTPATRCRGFWQIESASLIDFPQQQRLIEVFDNNDGSGSIRGSILDHTFERSRRLAEADDQCQLYLSDPQAVATLFSDADLASICMFGGTRDGSPEDRNVELMFTMPTFN